MTTPTYYRDQTTANRFYAIPGDPTPEVAPNGAPTILLWVSDRSARLQLGVQWKVTASEDAELRRIIALHDPALTPGALNLQPAPSSVQKVELLVGEDAATRQPVATATSAGFPPYTTLFTVNLDATQMNQVVAALHGRPGFLAVRYRLTIQNAEGNWEASERSADIGDWFANRVGSDHIRVLPVPAVEPIKPPSPRELQIRVSAALDSAPLAYIHVERDGQTALLRPPDFAPVTLAPAKDNAPVRCTTYYTTGQPYSTSLPVTDSAPAYQLTPADLGLALVTICAPIHEAAKAHEVRVLVRYWPTGAGSDDERTVYLRGSHWQEAWWVITRHPTLQGELEITAKVTQATGAVLNPPRYRQASGEVVIG